MQRLKPLQTIWEEEIFQTYACPCSDHQKKIWAMCCSGTGQLDIFFIVLSLANLRACHAIFTKMVSLAPLKPRFPHQRLRTVCSFSIFSWNSWVPQQRQQLDYWIDSCGLTSSLALALAARQEEDCLEFQGFIELNFATNATKLDWVRQNSWTNPIVTFGSFLRLRLRATQEKKTVFAPLIE